MVVFRPFAGEVEDFHLCFQIIQYYPLYDLFMNITKLAPQILVGRISSSNKDGILVSLDFFDDVFIPSYLLQAPSEFNAETSLWLWKYGEEDSGDEFVMDIGEQVTSIYHCQVGPA
jgi:RNA polymerase III subunit Rpc25